MKTTLELKKVALVASIAFVAMPALAQTTAVTDAVGYVTLDISGTGGGPAAYSFRGMPLTRTVAYQGAAETASGGTTSIVDNEAVWTDDQFNGVSSVTHYVEITSGPAAGTTYDIVDTVGATKTLTLAQSLDAAVVAGVTFKIRQHWTIGSVFGPANEGGLFGGTVSTADQILIWNGTGFDTYYYKTTGLGGVGWRSTASTSADRSGQIIYPDDGLVVKRNQTAAASVVILGSVKTGQTSFPVFVGNNFISNTYAAPMTLGSSGLYTGSSATGLAGGTVTSADQVSIWNGTGYDTYYYKTVGLGGTGWRSTTSTSNDASGVSIPVGSSVVVNRKTASAFNWVVPQHPSSF